MNKTFLRAPVLLLILFALMAAVDSVSVNAQSTNVNFPTPLTASDIAGKIPARDIGDSRLTSYFYVFNGNQGDLFINVVTGNFNGDIDLFTAGNLRPLTKIVVYADASENETGRVVYLRKPEKLILRIEGRTPNDDPATFRIKFAGSFQAMSGIAENETTDQPVVKAGEDTDVKVNSVGTIIAVKPKPTPKPKEVEVRPVVRDDAAQARDERTAKSVTTKPAKPKKGEEKAEKPADQDEVAVAEPQPKKDPVRKPRTEKELKEAPPKKPDVTRPNPKPRATPKEDRSASAKPKTEPAPNPLENLRLVVLFKDGTRIDRPMTDILRVGVDNKGVLTIISKDGSVGRYSFSEVAKMTIE